MPSRDEKCERCDGTGGGLDAWNTLIKNQPPCPRCKGTGIKPHNDPPVPDWVELPENKIYE